MNGNGSQSYEGPAGVVFSDDELLVIWSDLTRIPTAKNGEIRRRIKQFLEHGRDWQEKAEQRARALETQ